MKAIVTGCTLLLALVSLPTVAQSVRSLSLGEVLEAAVLRSPAQPGEGGMPPYQASAWLAGLPSVSVSYLDSSERTGTDETELALDLPLNSPRQRRVDRSLRQLDEQLREAHAHNRRLLLSGLIREAVWSQRIAAEQADSAGRKMTLLRRLEQRQRELHAGNAISTYALLLVEKELVDAELQQMEFKRAAQQWMQRYRQLTGLGVIPEQIEEPEPVAGAFRPQQHPAWVALDLGWLQRQQLLLAASPQAEPWNLSLYAKQLDSPALEENQYGLGLEIPLTFLRVARASDNSQWLEESRRTSLEKDRLALELEGRWNRLVAEGRALREGQDLLQRASELGREIAREVKDLQASNELEEEIALRRIMEAIDGRAEVAVNRLRIAQNVAMRRQAAGLAL